ncbi:hypothetical protein Tco_1423160, partial [Tanacetum coccineum]
MSPGGSAMASCEDVNSFLACNTPPDHLIRIYYEQEGVVPLTMKFPAWYGDVLEVMGRTEEWRREKQTWESSVYNEACKL